MKNIKNYKAPKLVPVLIVILALIFYTVSVVADSSVGFYGRHGNPIWNKNNITVYSKDIESINDLFGLNTKELEPGAQRTVNIRLENNSDESYAFYMGALVRTDEYARKLEEYFPGKTADDSLLDAININVSFAGGDIYAFEKNIYSGKLSGHSDSDMYKTGGVLLGNHAPHSSGNIKVSIYIPKDIDSSYMNTLCAVNWLFTAQQDDTPPVVPNKTPAKSPASLMKIPFANPTGSVLLGEYNPDDSSRIEDDGNPLGSGNNLSIADKDNVTLESEDNFIELDDDDIPLDISDEETQSIVVVVDSKINLPKTGDIKTYAVPIAITMASLLFLLALTYRRQRK